MSAAGHAADPPVAAGPVAREPWIAANLSAFAPGLGEMYAGRVAPGAGRLVLQAVLLVSCIAIAVTPGGPMPLFFALALLVVANFAASILGAHRAVARSNPPEFEEARRAEQDPWRAAFWSRLWPGIGHLVLRRWWLGVVWLASPLLVGAVVGAAVGSEWLGAAASWLEWSAGPGLTAAAAWHAWSLAPAGRRGADRTIVALMAGILIAGAGATLFTAALRTRVVQAFRIPSASMAPVLVPGDYLFANKSPGASIARGDVVVYRHPANPSQEFIHRVVAVPGDEVEIRAKRLIVNGATPDEPYAWHADTTIWVAAESSRDHFGPLKLGGDAYFVLGDNRDNANDSRFLGPVRREAIRGRATNRYWPPSRWGAVR